MKTIFVMSIILLIVTSCSSAKRLKTLDNSLDNTTQYGNYTVGLKKNEAIIQSDKDLVGYYDWIVQKNDVLEEKNKSALLRINQCYQELEKPLIKQELFERPTFDRYYGKSDTTDTMIVHDKMSLIESIEKEDKYNKEASSYYSNLILREQDCHHELAKAKKQEQQKLLLEKRQAQNIIKSLNKGNPKIATRGIAQEQEQQIIEQQYPVDPPEQQQPEQIDPPAEPPQDVGENNN